MTKVRKLPLRYGLLTVAMVAVAHIYALFGRGVRSDAMDNMHLYALLLGFLVFAYLGLLERILRVDFTRLRFYRLFFNLYNAGLASLLCGRMLEGIIEIAGGSSAYPQWFVWAGLGLIVIAVLLFVGNLFAQLRQLRTLH